MVDGVVCLVMDVVSFLVEGSVGIAGFLDGVLDGVMIVFFVVVVVIIFVVDGVCFILLRGFDFVAVLGFDGIVGAVGLIGLVDPIVAGGGAVMACRSFSNIFWRCSRIGVVTVRVVPPLIGGVLACAAIF